MIPLNELPAEDFESLVDCVVRLSSAQDAIECRIERVERSPYPTGRSIPGFSVFLRGPLERPLDQGLYSLEHPRHGGLSLFLTPIGRDAEGIRYEIVFN